MAQSNAPVGAGAAKPQVAATGRLILQDPLSFDQATLPSLRSSLEMAAQPVAGMDREKARELWESLSLEPEVAQEKQAERKRLLARAEQLAQEAVQAKAQSAALEAQLAKERDERLNHPLVYAGVAGLFGLGALWWLERRKRMLLQERELEMWAQSPESQSSRGQHDDAPMRPESSYTEAAESVFLLEEASSQELQLNISDHELRSRAAASASASLDSDDQRGLKNHRDWPTESEKRSQPLWEQTPSEKGLFTDPQTEEELVAKSLQKKDSGWVALSKRLLQSAIGRGANRDAAYAHRSVGDSGNSTVQDKFSLSTRTPYDHSAVSTQLLHDEETQIQSESVLDEHNLSHTLESRHSTDQANIDLLSRMRVTARGGEDAVEHLLELRMAVNGLCALGRPEGARRLLLEHIESSPDTCAWAYLECMQLCEQLDQRQEFETLRQRYRQEFNRMAPYWHEPNANVIGLDGYARATSELCTAWAQGSRQAHSVLAAWLTGPLIGRKLVQLPAYHDLFDLYELLEFLEQMQHTEATMGEAQAADVSANAPVQTSANGLSPIGQGTDFDFVTTVSLLDLDYEFSSDVTLEEREVAQSEKAVTIVKPGNFSVDFNVTGTQLGGLFSQPADLDKK